MVTRRTLCFSLPTMARPDSRQALAMVSSEKAGAGGLRKILERRNLFLKRHRDDVNHGSHIAICKQAHIKLEVVFFMYLWSIDPEAVQVSMSCFSLLCEEADIRCRSDEITSTFLLPNYQVGAIN